MADLKPKQRARVEVPTAQIHYMVKNSKYTYTQIVQLIDNILKDVLDTTIADTEFWIDHRVPKRTGQLRHMLKLWLNGSNFGQGLLTIVLGTNLAYAEKVNEMSTAQVRHVNDYGYVYYPNIFGINSKTKPRGQKKILLHDPRAVGFFFDKMIDFVKHRLDINLIRAKNKHLGSTVKINRTIRSGMAVS
jgi:hypothetical protein